MSKVENVEVATNDLEGAYIAGDVVEQASAAGRGVVDLVDGGAELAAPGCHAVHRFSGPDPNVGAHGVDQQLLDRRVALIEVLPS